MRILLVEDDPLIGAAIKQALKTGEDTVDWAQDGKLAQLAIDSEDFAVVLLDLGLPGKDGFDILKHIRTERKTVPVIVITARDAVDDRVKGLDLGADDYLVKPFQIAELKARIRAVTRRHIGLATSTLSNDSLALNLNTCEVRQNGHLHALTSREFALLKALLSYPGKVFSRDELEQTLYGWNEEVSSNAVEVIIHGLRKKLGKDAIRNIRGLGWLVSK